MRRTKSGLPKYCSYNRDEKSGKTFVRFRHGGIYVYLTGVPWSPPFMAQLGEALSGIKPDTSNVASSRVVTGTMNELAAAYYRSPIFRDLKASTQTMRGNIIKAFCKAHGDKPVKLLTRLHVGDIIGARAETPMAANNLLKVLRSMLDLAVARKMIEANPAIGVKGYRVKGDGHHTWTEGEVKLFEGHHPLGSKARLAIALFQYTAQRKGDVVCMGWQNVHGDLIAVRQEKTDEPLLIPIHPELASVLAATPRKNMTFLMTERGAPFTSAGFGNWFRDRCDEAGLPQCSAHGLRKLAAVRLNEAGCTNEQMKAIGGWKSDQSLKVYTKASNQQKLARQAMNMQIGAEREQKMASDPIPLAKAVRK